MMSDPKPDPADAVVIDCDLAHPPERVWRALTEPKLLGAWLLPNDIKAEEGAYKYYGYVYGYSAEEDGAAAQISSRAGEIS